MHILTCNKAPVRAIAIHSVIGNIIADYIFVNNDIINFHHHFKTLLNTEKELSISLSYHNCTSIICNDFFCSLLGSIHTLCIDFLVINTPLYPLMQLTILSFYRIFLFCSKNPKKLVKMYKYSIFSIHF